MNLASFLVVWFCAAACLFGRSIVVAPSPNVSFGFIFLAWITSAISHAKMRQDQPLRPRSDVILAAVALGIAAVSAPAAEFPSIALFCCGAVGTLVGTVFPRLRRRSDATARAAIDVATILLIQAAAQHLFVAFSARRPDVPLMESIFAPLLAFLGFDAAASGGMLHIHTLKYTHAIPMSWGHLGALPALLFFVGTAFHLFSDGRATFSRLVGVAATVTAFSIARFVAVVGLFVTRMLFCPHESREVAVDTFWLPSIVAASFLPLPFLLARLFTGGNEPQQVDATDGAGRRMTVVALAAATGILGTLALFWPDPGEKKDGRVLIDESKSAWEKTDRPLTTDWYGALSGYNFAAMSDYIDRHFVVKRHDAGPLTDAVLAQTDVLILKTPTAAYAEAEIDAIESFVEKGGGLFLLGDHTNVFGSSVHLNAVARRFGLALRYDCVFDIHRKWEQLYRPADIGRHPILRGVPYFLFAVSASIETSDPGARSIIRGERLWTLPIDYAPLNFYPEVLDATHARFGAFDQMVENRVGKGRVVCFADSTVFSNFETAAPGKLEMLVATIDWLNRRNRFEFVGEVSGWLGGFLALLLLRSARRRNDPPAAAVAIATMFAATYLTLGALDRLSGRFYPAPSPRLPIERVAFPVDAGDYELPIFGFPQRHAQCYAIFYMWTLRQGLFPRADLSIADATSNSDVVVVIRPRRPPRPDEIANLRQYVERGGGLLVLDAHDDSASSADAWLSPFGIGFEKDPALGRWTLDADGVFRDAPLGEGKSLDSRSQVRIVRGGRALVFSDAGEPVVAESSFGRGRVIAAGLAELFADPSMGRTHTVTPTDAQRAVYEIQFSLLRSLGDRTGSLGVFRDP